MRTGWFGILLSCSVSRNLYNRIEYIKFCTLSGFPSLHYFGSQQSLGSSWQKIRESLKIEVEYSKNVNLMFLKFLNNRKYLKKPFEYYL